MTILNNKCYFTVYGNWFDDPYECKYLVDNYLLSDNKMIINLENGNFQITINDYKKIKIKSKYINIKEASKVIINWFAFDDQKEIYECSVSYTRAQNQIVEELVILNSPPYTKKLPIKGPLAFKLFY